MKIGMLIVCLFAFTFVAYALDHGIYVGTHRYLLGAPCCPQSDYIVKACHYLFVTGISEIDAADGFVRAPNAKTDGAALAAGLSEPDNGHCSLFSK
jgi:hypothetical protein